ncbi:hypothetical protein F3C99_11410 [Vitellibacter sp. q18]|nr:hypothetical protein [Aequorivita lutea]
MKIEELEKIWDKAIKEILGKQIDNKMIYVLANQTSDSIRRIQIYDAYRLRAQEAVQGKKSFFHTSNPFVLAQRSDLNYQNRVWIIYLATYFGKSNKSKWELFNRATFRKNQSIILFDEIQADLNNYFKFLVSFDFFQDCDYSNHRKFTPKNLLNSNGLFRSIEYFVKNVEFYSSENEMEFDEMYLRSQKIPNFGRLAGFDFTSSLVKCRFNIKEPKSMYADNSTGPLQALELLLKLTNNNSSKVSQKQLSADLMEWFLKNSRIYMTGQVLEDAICNWQKNTVKYIRYSG